MKRFIAVLVSGIAVFFLSACGGGGGGSTTPTPTPPVEPAPPPEPVDPMIEKDIIVIMYNYPAEICLAADTKEKMENLDVRMSNFLFYVENNNVGCGTYGKVNGVNADGTEGCKTSDQSNRYPYKKYDTSCVMGADYNPDAGIAAANAEYLRGVDVEEIVSTLEDAVLEAL